MAGTGSQTPRGTASVGFDDLPTGWGVGKVVAAEPLADPATPSGATHVGYDNTTSGLGSTQLQGAVDELAAGFTRGRRGNARTVVFADSPVTLSTDDYTLFCDTSGGPIVVNLPNAAAFAPSTSTAEFQIKLISADANGVAVTPFAGDSIEGVAAAYPVVGPALLAFVFKSDGVIDYWVT